METNPTYRVIAIDGPAASGKSSVARRLAERTGFACVNSGAFYRALTWLVCQKKADPANADELSSLLANTQFESTLENGHSVIQIDGQNPEPHLSDPDVNSAVSKVSSQPVVRAFLLEKLRSFSNLTDLVMEGRDIGSTVFPDTPFKFYIDASEEERARRRAVQGLQDSIAERDRMDTSRKNSPLSIARDASVIDTTYLGIDAVVDVILEKLQKAVPGGFLKL